MAFKKTAQMLIIKRPGLAGSPSAYGTCYPRLPKETVNNEVPPCQGDGIFCRCDHLNKRPLTYYNRHTRYTHATGSYPQNIRRKSKRSRA